MGIPDHLTCLLKNLYAGQEVTELDMEQQTSSELERLEVSSGKLEGTFHAKMDTIKDKTTRINRSKRY